MKRKCPLLISSSAKNTIKESVLLANELNTGIEISRIPLYKDKNMTVDSTIDFLQSELNGFEGKRTLHAMFSDVNISSRDWELREIAQKRFIQSFQVGKAIGADTILFHTGNKGTKHYGSIKSFKKNFVLFWNDFVKEFEKSGIIAVVENVFETTPNYCLELFNSINSPNFKLALDTGHVNLYAHDTTVTEWLKAYNSNLYHMHLHNNFRENDDHSNLENGTLNFKEIFETIKELNIEPSCVLEMFTEEDIRKSVELFDKYMTV
ncbi:sugar phosphate isomerase/epimerase [bacterium]|nr:sugar phosphate isomerase/epimerase [bacterium]